VLVLSQEVLDEGESARAIFKHQSLNLVSLPLDKTILEYITSFKPACVILDIRSSLGNGFNICQEIRKNNDAEQVALVMVTDRADDEFRYKLYDADTKANNFIVSPVNLNLLARIVNHEIKITRKTQELKLGIETYKNTLSQSPFGVVVIRDDYTIDFTNQKFFQWLDYNSFDVINNRSILDFCYGDSRSQLEQKIDECLRTDSTEYLECKFIKSNQEEEINFKITLTEIDWKKKELEYLQNMIAKANGNAFENNNHGILMFFEDLSLVAEYQQQILEKNLELYQINKLQEGIIRSYHHDIRGICTSMNSLIKIFLLPEAQNVNTQGFVNDLEKVADNARLLIRTVDELRNLAKEGRKTNALEEVQLKNNIDYVKKGFSGDIKSAGAVVKIPEKFPLVKVIRAEFTQIFSNLMSNSLKFRSLARKLTINITYDYEQGKQLVIKFADNGIGVEPDKLESIFKGYRHDNSIDNSIEGEGIGLSQVKSIINRYGGTVRAESEGIDKGLTIVISLNDDIIVKNKVEGE
jgi:signal transduction histidine kinase/DNA-binding response OmpR family regulator